MEEIPIEEFSAAFAPNCFTYSSDAGLHLIKSAAPANKVISLNADPIRSEKVREFLRQSIDFLLTNEQWLVIDVAMGKYWNNRVPGIWICNEDIAGFIFRHCEHEKMLISWERVLKITNGIWEYLEINGRLIDDNRI